MKNELEILNLINKLQSQLSVMDRKIDTLMSRSLLEGKPSFKATVPTNTPVAPVKSHDRPKERVMFTAICADCKKECKIPFKPNGDRPVYCQDCFSHRKVISMSGMKIEDKPKETMVVQTQVPAAAPKAIVKKKKGVAAKKTVVKKKSISKKKR